MFGFSLAELILVLLVAIIFIKPQDLPEVAHFFGRLYYKARRLIDNLKQQLKEVEKELGLEEIKHEINRGIAAEKIKMDELKNETENEIIKIVDIYGNEHEINVSEAREDLTKEEIAQEVLKYNEMNSKKDESKKDSSKNI